MSALTRRPPASTVLFAAHRYASETIAEFHALSTAHDGPTLLLWDRDASPTDRPELADLPRFEFDRAMIRDLGFPTFRDSGLKPGSVHFPLLAYARRNRSRHFWFIEYDVRYTGAWRDFLAAFEDAPEDFITGHLTRLSDAPGWPFWPSLKHPRRSVPRCDRIRAFNPIYRISERALRHVDRSHRSGWTGHQEVLIPTLLDRSGFTLRDFGGCGPWVSTEDRERHYLAPENRPDPKGTLDGSTLRFKPDFHSLEGLPGGKLIHPFRPPSV